MCNKSQETRDMLLKLGDRVLEVDLAHSQMLESLLDARTAAQEISPKVQRKWSLAVYAHKKLGSEIRQLLREINEVKHRLNAEFEKT